MVEEVGEILKIWAYSCPGMNKKPICAFVKGQNPRVARPELTGADRTMKEIDLIEI